MPASTLMIQGTASHVGKSVVTAALCRSLARRGYRVAPFKAQNMSLNSAVTRDGGEIGRSQAFQAAACGIEPEVGMNPILLKPMSGHRCQVIVRGRPQCVTGPGTAGEHSHLAAGIAAESLVDLRRRFDVVLIEGMGSPAEINLRGRDTANMRIAELADAPVLLVGDIERGGVFAALAGTMELLPPLERVRVRGFLVNKYHGDRAVLEPGLEELERRYGVPALGVLPWLPDLRVDEEDSVALDSKGVQKGEGRQVDVLVTRLPGISNFTDLAPLEAERCAQVRYIERAADWGDPDLVVLPGSRSVAADLGWLRERSLVQRIVGHAGRGGRVIGICGGYQMLGRAIRDPQGVEGPASCAGLGLLDVVTTFAREKNLAQASGRSLVPGLEGKQVTGYEIHHGQTCRGAGVEPAFQVLERCGGPVSLPDGADGASDARGRVFGTYLHGLFESREFRHAILTHLGGAVEENTLEAPVFDFLADWVEANVRIEKVMRLLQESGFPSDV
jgi:adenosylcobyric acid synthase